MNLDMSIFHQTFFEEAADLLEDLEGRLLQLDETPDDPELLNTIFRCAHSIKGGSATFGFTEIAHFTHGLETLLDLLRTGQLHVDHALTQLLLEAQDQLKALLAVARGMADSAPDSAPLVARIEAAIIGDKTEQASGTPDENLAGPIAYEDGTQGEDCGTEDSMASSEITEPFKLKQWLYHLRLAPHEDVLRQGTDIARLLAQLGEAGEIRSITCDQSRLPSLAALNPESVYLAWDIVLQSDWEPEHILEIFEFIEDESEILLSKETMSEFPEANSVDLYLPELTASVPIVAQETLAPLAALCVDGPAPVKGTASPGLPSGSPATSFTSSSIASALSSEAQTSTPRMNVSKMQETATLRVATDKVDKLINLVGELIINQSMLNEVVQNFSMAKLPRLNEAVSEMERACRELQERVMAVRMLPIKHAFGRFPRLVHDLSVACGKKIELKTTGEETELDKTVIESIADPLTHLIRNSVDHGLETPEERRAAEKPETGIIALNAFHEGGNIVIEVSDDGRGLDRERILRKAYERGLLSESDPAPSDETVYSMIFNPGLSTAAKLTDLSGRGVGMDIVKQTVQGLGGSITLSSTPGKGSRFRVRLPLTMAILEGLSLAVGKEVYILPLTSIIESIRPKAGDVRRIVGGAEVVLVRGEVLTILRLYEVFGAEPGITEPTQGLLVIVENDGHKVALLVDELIGQSQVVIKSLETNYRKVDGIAGATILGDGRVALIVDIPGLIRGTRSGSAMYAA